MKLRRPGKSTGHGTSTEHRAGLTEILERDRHRKAVKRSLRWSRRKAQQARLDAQGAGGQG